jgi:sodium/proline symporter
MVAGAATVIIWADVLKLSDTMYEMVPGFIACLIAIFVVSIATEKPSASIENQFDEYKNSMQ